MIALKYFFALFGGILADSLLGKFSTLMLGCTIFFVGNCLLFVPEAIHTWGPWGIDIPTWTVFLALFMGAIGNGLATPCLSTFIGDQFSSDQEDLRSKYFSWFYFFIQLGAIAGNIGIPFTMKYISLVVTFAILAGSIVLVFPIFVLPHKQYKKVPPGRGSFITFFAILGSALKNRGAYKRGERAPLLQADPITSVNSSDGGTTYHWLDPARLTHPAQDVDDVRRALNVMLVFVPMPFFWAVFFQTNSLWIFQATNTNLKIGGLVLPAAAISSLNPVLDVLLIPVFSNVVYPLCARFGRPLGPLARMSLGFLCTALAAVAAALVQMAINAAPAGGPPPSVFILLPQFLLISCGEILLSVTAYEFAYTQAPPSQKGMLTAVWILTLALGSAGVAVVGLIDFGTSPIQYFAFAGAIVVVWVVYGLIARSYKYDTVPQGEAI
eukprot:TRINITY_DN10848_c0_g1_i2.p1 TRINITY_DN10848_c0_g1~~TRINITY_DN10848_c0_g1_i2.p1  ORF type:complete len:503 (+),score=93.92 TRINITY_DN10848_c0_g1_i2:194-1510(+)